jgi:dye decolorizing peroxidase
MKLPSFNFKTTFIASILILAFVLGALYTQRTETIKNIGTLTEPFYGIHQSGIDTKKQANLTLLAFDLLPNSSKESSARLMRLWTNDSANLTSGKEVIGDINPGMEANPARLTVTFGFGHSFFKKIGIPNSWPLEDVDIPAYPNIDKLENQWNGGDIVVQICGDDPLAIFHLAAVIKKDGMPFARIKWQQRGFLNAAGVNEKMTGRNLLGQLDGTANPDPASKEFSSRVWRSDGSTVMVVRRIQMAIENWDRLSTDGKARVTGRKILTGAPINGSNEKSPVNKASLAPNSHVGISFTSNNSGIFRRGFNYDDGYFPDGTRNAGLIFISFQESLKRYTNLQKKLASIDALNTWTTPIGSGLYYVPKGVIENKQDWILRSILTK